MKKQYNNISAYAGLVFGLLLTGILCFACQEDDLVKNAGVKEGVPVKMSLTMSVPQMQVVSTRGLGDDEEFQINDLYLLIFDARGKKKEGTHYYTSEELAANNGGSNNSGTQATPTTGKLMNIETTSGQSYIFAAANTGSNQLDGDGSIRKKLDAVETLEDFRKVTATLNSQTEAAQVDRTQAALVMCGAYIPNAGSSDVEGECVIPAEDGNLNGKILLERLDSHITFNISWGGEKSKVTSFELTGWRVYNVPVKSYLLAGEQDAAKDEKDYSTTILENKSTLNEAGNLCSFNFYMLENRKQAKEYEGTPLQSYADREAEVKENGLNTGIYKYADPHATYVEIKADMELTSTKGGGGSKKLANVTYTIHLGEGSDKDFTGFESKRNKKYTYNIQINDTEDIRVEVEDGDEKRPGAEGDVVDTEAKVYSLDAHYNCFIIGLSKNEARELGFVVRTPFATIDNNTDENGRAARGDYQWIRFRRSDNASTLAEYPALGEGLIDLFGLSADILSQSGENDDEKFYYTVFVDEYYYDNPPAGQNWDKPYWKHFVNQKNREVIFTLSPKYSEDKESSYTDAQYLITQRSIQTYYRYTGLDKEQAALGMEHVNETGEPGTGGPGNIQTDPSNGFFNTYGYITLEAARKEWNWHANMTTPNVAGNTFTLKNQNGWSACLSRNRDENQNGTIDPEELKWYLPTRDQLIGMYLGAESLSTPLFDADAHPKNVKSGDSRYHYLLSNGAKIWAEEGASVGARKEGDGYPKQLRCVRNLNLDMNAGNAMDRSAKVGNAFEYKADTHVFTMLQLDEKNIRGKQSSGELGLHHNFSSTNRPYTAFQMAARFYTEERGEGKWKDFVNIGKLHRSKCSTYSEKEDQSDKGKWRTPNQREFMIMYIQNKANVAKFTDTEGKEIIFRAYSRTEWKYDTEKQPRYFGYNQGIMFLDNGQIYDIALRCVRDVDVDPNGNIIEDN